MNILVKNTLRRSAVTAGTSLAVLALMASSVGVAFAADTSNLDTNGDGYLSVVEAAPDYGSIVASLTTTGDTSPASALAVDRFPVANANGTETYSRTFTISDDLAQDIRNNQAEIVQHGIDLDNDGMYDGTATSSVDASLPLEATIPADCGLLQMTGTNTAAAQLTSINVPHSQATGSVTASLDGDQLTVNITSTGLSPNLPHAQHIHFGGTHMCPPASVSTTTGMTGTGSTTGTGIGTSTGSFANAFAAIQAKITALQGILNTLRTNLTGIFGNGSLGTGMVTTGTSASGGSMTSSGSVMIQTPTAPMAPTAPMLPAMPQMHT